jgi:uncharacterized protein YecE (DUF72 family)
MLGKVRLGCSGWAYKTWRPAFYPEKTPLSKLLPAYAHLLNTVEVNYTFRRLPTATIAANWLKQTPSNFRFAFKAPQTITHLRRLRDAGVELRAFAASLQPIADAKRLGPQLFQLPPNFKLDLERLSAFLEEAHAAGLKTAWEFRDASWFCDETYKVLAAAGAVLCAAESDTLASPDLALQPRLRVYRLRRSSYSTKELAALAAKFTTLAQDGVDVYAFFKHEDAPDGPLRALHVLEQVPAELRG